MIQKQIWKDEIRILLTNELSQGSVQISIPFYDSDILGKADALIYALNEESERFVFEFYKRCGYKPFDGNNNFLIKKL